MKNQPLWISVSASYHLNWIVTLSVWCWSVRKEQVVERVFTVHDGWPYGEPSEEVLYLSQELQKKNNLSSGGHTNCKFYKWISSLDFPGGPLIENLPANAGSMGSDPWSGRIPCAMGQISPSTAIAESMCCKYWTLLALEPMLCNKRSPCREKPRQCNWRVTPHLLQLEKAYAQQWRPSTTKN